MDFEGLDFSQLLPDEHEGDEDFINEIKGDGVPMLMVEPEAWVNYTDDNLYFMDKKVREFLKKARYKREHMKGGFRTTPQLVFAWIFGRKAETGDNKKWKYLRTLLEYYCTEWIGPTTFQGKKVSRVYKFPKRTLRRPYSLRLRMEENVDDKDIWRRNPYAGEDKRSKPGRGNRAHS